MIAFRSLPIKARLTLGYAAAMAVLLGVIGLVLYLAVGAVLLDELETGLRSRAATIEASMPRSLQSPEQTRGLIESREAFAQIVTTADGRVVASSRGFGAPLLPAAALAAVRRPTYFSRHLPGVADTAKLLAVPTTRAGRRYVVIAGASMSDRSDALRTLTIFFALGGPVALAIASLVGWFVARSALRPVETMRGRAAAISALGDGERLPVPDADDELRRLATTLNEMLARRDEAMRAERRFLDNASHELRTPLTALKAELDLALSKPRSRDELERALASASEEADRLARMADDLLLLSRAQDGRLPVHRQPVALDELLRASAQLFAARAARAGVTISVDAPNAIARVDRDRVRQAVDNLIDNACRYGRHTIVVRGQVDDGGVTIRVEDDGPGFPAAFVPYAFEPFRRPDHDGHGTGAGLGLAIVQMVAGAHGGRAAIEPDGRGGVVTVHLRSEAAQNNQA